MNWGGKEEVRAQRLNKGESRHHDVGLDVSVGRFRIFWEVEVMRFSDCLDSSA